MTETHMYSVHLSSKMLFECPTAYLLKLDNFYLFGNFNTYSCIDYTLYLNVLLNMIGQNVFTKQPSFYDHGLMKFMLMMLIIIITSLSQSCRIFIYI